MPQAQKDGVESQSSTSEWALFYNALLRNATLLTPNARTARLLASRFDEAARLRGKSSWQAANIMPWHAWTASLWHHAVVHGLDSRVLLNEVQERAIWRRVILGESRQPLESADAQARLCIRATRLLGSYDTDARFIRASAHEETQDGETFRRWYSSFEDLCSRDGLLPPSHLQVELAALLRQGRLVHGGEYLLYGLDSMTPAQSAVLHALEAAGATVASLPVPQHKRTPPALLRCETSRAEMQRCAHWVRQQLEQNPQAAVAIVVPGLDALRPELERELRDVVAPGAADVTRPDSGAPYEFSIGRPLHQLPLIQDALRLLHWCVQEVTVADAGAILRSRYLTLAASPELGAELDASVLKKINTLRRTLTIEQAANALERYEVGDRLLQLEREAARCRAVLQSFAWFADKVRELLLLCGWPGPASLQSREFQAVERWNEMLDRLASLDLLGGRTGLAGFLEELDRGARDTLFAPENLGAPVQVLGPEEAVGSTVDALWFLQAHSSHWPARARPHALLPWRLQNELGMPGTDPARDEAAAKTELAMLMGSASTACFSWSPDDGADAEDAQRPSPLVEQAVLECGGSLGIAAEIAEEFAVPSFLVQEVDDVRLPPLADERVSGGTGLLKAQAQCGFRAFAEKRLFTVPIEQGEPGLSPSERGDQVHEVLELFWKRVPDQKTLKKMHAHLDDQGISARDRLLRECIGKVTEGDPPGRWEAAYLEVQQQRLFKLLSSWLDFEAERPSFEVVLIEEKLKDVPVGPLMLSMRVDRVDRVTAGGEDGLVVIDYKTGGGSNSANEWLGERLDEPQLPVYAVAGAVVAGLGRIDGLAFGGVRVGKNGMKLDGLAADPALLWATRGKAIDFEDQVETWRRDLDRLATAFAEGDAAVDPKQYPITCKNCGQRMLCRVDAAAILQIEDPDDLDGDEAAGWS